jgi:glycosyltransferase involved in cell wall biosynthesis
MGILPLHLAVRIGLIVYGSLNQTSGGYLYDRQLTAALEADGHAVTVISLAQRAYLANLAAGLRGAEVERSIPSRLDVIVEDELCHPSLAWLSDRTHGLPPRIGLVHHLRQGEASPRPLQWLYRTVERRYLRSAAGFICNSSATQRSVEGTLGTSIQAIIAYPGRDHIAPQIGRPSIEARSAHPGPLRVLFVGSLIRRKRVDALLDAVAQLPDGSCVLSLVGRADLDHRYVRALRRRVAADGRLGQRVRFFGDVTSQALAEHYQRSDVFCVPSQLEGYGIAYLEAMGFGLPVLASANGGAGELVDSGINGYMVSGDDPSAIAAHLDVYAADRRELRAHSLAARARWEQQPCWRDTAEAVSRFLSGIVQGS